MSNQYNRLRKTNKKLMNQVKLLKMLLGSVSIVLILTVIGLIGVSGELTSKDTKIDELEKTNSQLLVDNVDLSTKFTELSSDFKSLSDTVVEINDENIALSATCEDQAETLKEYQEREELYNKYEYAIIRQEDDSRTDITYEDIKTLEEIASEKGMSNDSVELVLAIAMNESSGFADSKNSDSTASGLTGLLNGTAKYIYESYMGNGSGSYQYVDIFDPETNLIISLNYIDYLTKLYDGDTINVVNAYRGLKEYAYIRKINESLNEVNKSLDDIDL